MESKMTRTRYFDIVKGYEDRDINLPQRSTKHAAGYDFEAAETVVIPSMPRQTIEECSTVHHIEGQDVLQFNDELNNIKPVLVKTGIKASMYPSEYLMLANRSSNPKRGLVLANGIGIVDSDYFENPDNDGHIMFAFFNLGQQDVVINKGDRIGQGIFQTYLVTDDDDRFNKQSRSGGFGSTGQ